jgi:opacity protein-like surface antigen
MKTHLTAVAVSVGASLLLVSPLHAATQQQVVDIKDLNKCDTDKAKKSSHKNYLLNMGDFSSESYANRYKAHLAEKTNKPIKVEQSKEDKNIFHVLVGPFKDLGKLVQSGADMAGKTITSPTTTVHPVKKAPMKYRKTMRKPAQKFAKPMQTKHQKILASQADYPINHNSMTDPKGNKLPPLLETGPYVGASGGMLLNVGKIPATVAYQAANGILSAGIGNMYTRRFYLAGEFFGGSNVAGKNFTAGVNGYNISSAWFYGGDLIPGYMVTDKILAYLRLGVMRTQFNSKPGAPIVRFPPNSPYRVRQTIVANGWQVGVGSQVNLYKNLDGRSEYIFTYYKAHHIPNGRGEANQVNLGLVYKFSDKFHA